MTVRPVVVDIGAGRGGWTKAFLRAGWRVVGIDIKRSRAFPRAAKLLVQDVRTVDGTDVRLAGANLVVASPPCQEFSKHDNRSLFPNLAPPDMSIVHASVALARALGVPLVLENVRGLQQFIGPAIAHYGSFYLWGDGVPALLPKVPGRQGRPRLKWKHRSPALRAEIPFELAWAVAGYHSRLLGFPVPIVKKARWSW